MLSAAVQEVMDGRKWSLVRAEIATGVNRGTIQNMRIGANVGIEHVIKFARASADKGKEDDTVRRFLRLAAHDKVRRELLEASQLAGFVLDTPSVKSPTKPDPLLDVAEDVPNQQELLDALTMIVDVGANLERLTPNDETFSEPVELGGFARVMRIRHECMAPLLHPGDVIYITSPETANDGDIVIAAVDIFTRTCKVLRAPYDAPSYLEPLNGEGVITEERFTILGVVKYILQSVSELRKYRSYM